MREIEYIYLETTNYCNLDCSFCNRSEVVGNQAMHMRVEDWKRILKQLEDQPIREAKLMGLGEPFLHPRFWEICQLYKEAFPNSFLISATNCQYSISNNFRQAIRNIDMLYLSIDGWGENYERDRKPAKWKKLIKFLNELEMVDRGNCKMCVNYVVNPSNVFDIEKVQGLVEKYGLDELRLNVAQNWSESGSAELGYNEEQISYLQRWQPFIKGRAPWTFSDCFWPHNGLYVDVNGNVKVCCMNTSTRPLGNMFRQNLADIRSSPAFQAIKDGCLKDRPAPHCQNCSYKQLSPLLERLLPKSKKSQNTRTPAFHKRLAHTT